MRRTGRRLARDASFDYAAKGTLLRSGCCVALRSGSYSFTNPEGDSWTAEAGVLRGWIVARSDIQELIFDFVRRERVQQCRDAAREFVDISP